ncbi:MAG: hypothetical protein EBV06_09410 [Planctomycetia bacterium]|nr:hypothetical protein [Planctomycetia bacterium]
MRKMTMTMILAALLVLPALAQFRPGGGLGFGGGGQSGDALLKNKSVQKELKFTEEQTKAVTEIGAKQMEAIKEAFPLFKDDMEKAQEMMKKARETEAASLKKVAEDLTNDQKKRFEQIKIQVAATNKDVNVFKTESVIKTLSLTEKQQDSIKETIDVVAKDSKELFDDAKGDRKKMFEVGKKVTELRGEAFDKVVKMLSEDQKKSWTEAQGDKFDFKPDFGGFGKGNKGKGKDQPKKDDF